VIEETGENMMVGMYVQMTGIGLGFNEIFVIGTNNGTAKSPSTTSYLCQL